MVGGFPSNRFNSTSSVLNDGCDLSDMFLVRYVFSIMSSRLATRGITVVMMSPTTCFARIASDSCVNICWQLLSTSHSRPIANGVVSTCPCDAMPATAPAKPNFPNPIPAKSPSMVIPLTLATKRPPQLASNSCKHFAAA